MTRYYKATARGVTVTRSSATRVYTHAVISWVKARPADRYYPEGLPERAADPSFHSSPTLAYREAFRRSGLPKFVLWAEVAEVEEIDAKTYRSLKSYT